MDRAGDDRMQLVLRPITAKNEMQDDHAAKTAPSDWIGHMMQRMLAEFQHGMQHPSTDADGNAQISVGWGGDIPFVSDIPLFGSVLVGLLLARMLGRRPFVPAPLNLLALHDAIFAAAVRHPTSAPARSSLTSSRSDSPRHSGSTLSREDPRSPVCKF